MSDNKTNQKSIWSAFTKQYALNKTLRFELKPVGKTEDSLKQNKVFEKDKTIDDSYNQAKFYFDKLHQKFINEALSSDNVRVIEDNVRVIDFAEKFIELKNEIQRLKSEKKQKEANNKEKEINNLRKAYYKKIKSLLDKKAEEWKKEYKKKGIKFSKSDLEQKGTDFLMKSGILGILKYEFPKEKEEEFKSKDWPSLFVDDKANPGNKVYIFDSFDDFTTYLIKFQETRKNLYKDDGTSTSVATRVISNFEKFLNNKKIFEDKYTDYWQQIGVTEEEKKIFEIDYYYSCFTQGGIDEYNKIIGQINQKTKQYRDKNKIEKSKLPLFKVLDKQILGEVIKERELITKTETETEEEVFIKRFREFIDQNKKRIQGAENLMNDLVNEKFESEYAGIYLKRAAINTIANRWFKNTKGFLIKLPQASKSKENKKSPKVKPFISLLDIKNALNEFEKERESLGAIFKDKYYKVKESDEAPLGSGNQESYWEQFLKIWGYEFNQLFKDKFNEEGVKTFWGYTRDLEKEAENLNSFSRKKEEVALVKNYCDAALRIYQMMKYFALEAKKQEYIPSDYSNEFYNRFDEYYKDFEFIRYYNAIRNFVTKKPSNEDKIKINFESGELLRGWDISKIKVCLGIILIRDNEYYLGVVKKGKDKFFDYYENKNDTEKDIQRKNNLKKEIIAKPNEDYYIRVKYKQIADAGKDIYNLVLMPDGKVERFTDKKKKEKYWPEEIKRIKKESSFKNNKRDLVKFIDYFKKCASIYWKEFNLKFKSSEEYENFKEFTDSINIQGYKISLDEENENKIKSEYIEKQVNQGNLYLFKIINKDFYKHKKQNSKKNIHTLYWEYLFSNDNLIKNEYPLIRLSGGAEIFYRKSFNIKKEPVVLKRGNSEKQALRENKPIFHLNRYLEDKYLFHCPIQINATAISNISHKVFNQKINNFVSDKKEINIIGIDRGEKNLLYYTVINQKGEILEHGSLNEINGVNYFEKLIEREKERQINRQSWEPVTKIKDLKKGYLSYVVRKVADLVEKYNAIIILEDLNMRFKQVRGGIERSIYQQFEKQLIDKLGYLVFKDDKEPDAPGGVLNGYQLVAPFTTFKDLGKQTGIIFYTNAEYTSKTDPITGYRKNIYISNSASQKTIKENLINKLKALGGDEKEKSYFFTYNQKDFGSPISKEWTLYSKVPRVRREKNNSTGYWEYKPIDLNKEFEDLFKKYEINEKSRDILSKIKELIKNNEEKLIQKQEFDGKNKNFYERFIYLFNLLLEARNTISLKVKLDKRGNEIKLDEIDYGVDFFASPVKPFFTTAGVRFVGKQIEGGKIQKEKKEEFAIKNFADFERLFKGCSSDGFDSDGVGAYNIARKGIMILEKIKQNPKNPDLYISEDDWDKFAIKNVLVK
jgi:hypothetical protein